ncbi:hypothetical protein CGRA01v4_06989 [Colletotrichum graminicola]|uniref:Uncharacterized protein n=1 Tax=Colletotrichum graminicola (strain M1.001 / M2 / FGSC 10212) TaxID=645133 RepID=E3QR14_COLGM|nr:uncharacterized protein GLRG_08446 [Colletotrichum graminicola M1.001]EFQ33302.1 hypothetical protein GLRG_08446 [Colletotrichum graminicola M1.001]WDK15708.1 hypothetical protein CGRA01v4_06989 [Colletotrichum graminicola]
MENPSAKQNPVGSNPLRASSASLSEHRSNVGSAEDDKVQSSANTTVNSSENTNGRSIRSALRASWGKTLSKMLGKQARRGISLDEMLALEHDAVNKKRGGFAEKWDKRFDKLLNRPDRLKLQPSKSATDVNVASSYHDKNKGLLKRRSLGNIFGSVRARNTLKKGSKSREALGNTMGSSLSTQSLAKDPTTLDSAPPILPHLPPSGNLTSSIQVNLGSDPEKSSTDHSAQHLRTSTPTSPHRRDQAVQTPLTSIAERTDTKGKRTHHLVLPGMVDLHTGHELVWNKSTNPDALSVSKCNTLASASIAKPRLGRTRSDQLLQVSPTNDTADSMHTKRTCDLQIPRHGRQLEVRRSLKGDQVHIYSGKRILWVPEAKTQSMGEASTSDAAARNDTIDYATAGKGSEDSVTVRTDIPNIPSDAGNKNLKRKAKSLTFVRQLEIQPRGSSLTVPRRMSFKMDLRGTDSGQDDPKSSLHGDSDDDDGKDE